MGQFLFYYQRPEPATWVYMSSFLIVGIYFMFHRLWSIRNLDIILLLLLTPGLMLIHESYRVEQRLAESTSVVIEAPVVANMDQGVAADSERDDAPNTNASNALGDHNNLPDPGNSEKVSESNVLTGKRTSNWGVREIRLFGYVWLLSVCGLWLGRMLLDTTFFRRPLLEPNLTRGGLIFIGLSLFAFLMANVFNGPPAPMKGSQINRGPGFDPLKMLPDISTSATRREIGSAPQSNLYQRSEEFEGMKQVRLMTVSRVLLIVANSALVLGIVGVGFWHFSDIRSGVGAAVLYLLLPYAAQMVGRVEHAIPGSLLVLAVLFYRRPLISGAIIGLAGGLVFYPLFLLPLWLSFYWQRGQRRFILGIVLALTGLVIALGFASERNFFSQLGQMFGAIGFAIDDLDGIWGLGLHPYVRVPVVVAFVALAFSFAFWPAQKSLATLINCSAAIMVASQFSYAYGGGLLMAWYLPLILMAAFRPNLDDLVASHAVRPLVFSRRKDPPSKANLAPLEP